MKILHVVPTYLPATRDVPWPLAKLIMQLMAKNPDDRPGSADMVAWSLLSPNFFTVCVNRSSPMKAIRCMTSAGVLVALSAWQRPGRVSIRHSSARDTGEPNFRDMEA